ncbi:unnamed protein product [Schistosoma mattheei]|uniref:Uncharacterized protein n=1 Tax=Schistosoma mattheei TaxID=31246 RepID=A0A183PBN0_9TREM|nr:unnamed protein product [Schistosoma mattheei]
MKPYDCIAYEMPNSSETIGVDNVNRICGIIQHTADNLFLCHVLTCPTNAMELCKTLKAACESFSINITSGKKVHSVEKS